MKYDLATINYKVYEGKTNFCGIADITLPTLSFLTQTLNGVGISGNVDAVLIGQMDAMEMDINFNNTTTDTIKLATPVRHSIEAHAALQLEDGTTGEEVIQHVKHVLVAIPKSMSGGTLARASTGSPSGKYAVRYWAMYVDGVKQLELDPVNSVCYINGTDYLAPVRKAMGM